jgi:hypothetical protein
MRIVNRTNATVDYRLRRRNEGLRVWKDRCQIISPLGSDWTEVGPQLELPLEVPSFVEDFRNGADTRNVIRVAAFFYEFQQPGSDLFAVLMKEKPFESAFQAA